MSLDHAWITRYLDDEADLVVVDDRLDEFELGIVPATVVAIERNRPRRFSILVAAAAVVAVAVGLAALSRTPSTGGDRAAAPSTPISEPVVTEPSATDPTVPPTTVAPNEMPPGGIYFAGQTPVCAMVNADVYTCTLPSSYDPGGDFTHEVGMVTYYTNSSSLVAGGCRTTSPDARAWICYVGGRAVVENTITPYGVGDLYLGQPALNEYAAG